MSDLISRQAAIDALHMDTSIIPFKKAREYADATISEIRNRLEKLPSAQPATNCSEFPNNSDTISRQAAIDTIESWLVCDDYNEAERHIMRAMQSVLYDLPPVKLQESYEDVVSRQAVEKITEEAINEIKQIQCFDKPFDNSVEECNKFAKREIALNMAIKALEQEPCEDCISRKDTLEAMIKQLGIKNEDYLIPAEATLYKVVKNMPPVNPQEPKWIPVDYDRYPETYPKAFQEVWLTDGEGEVKHKAYDGTRNIKAWMPYIKPEPYKAESEE